MKDKLFLGVSFQINSVKKMTGGQRMFIIYILALKRLELQSSVDGQLRALVKAQGCEFESPHVSVTLAWETEIGGSQEVSG